MEVCTLAQSASFKLTRCYHVVQGLAEQIGRTVRLHGRLIELHMPLQVQ